MVWLLPPAHDGAQGQRNPLPSGRHRTGPGGRRVRQFGQRRQPHGSDSEVRRWVDADQPKRRRRESEAGPSRRLSGTTTKRLEMRTMASSLRLTHERPMHDKTLQLAFVLYCVAAVISGCWHPSNPAKPTLPPGVDDFIVDIQDVRRI